MKYGICPKCKEEINFLNCQSEQSTTSEKDFNYEEYDSCEDSCENEFRCPECDEVLATNEAEAIKLLTSESEEA
jgi:phage FluMu protein Com